MTARISLEQNHALDWLQEQPANSIDFLLTDPPYNVTNLSYEGDMVWDGHLFRRWWEQVKHAVKSNAWIAMFGVDMFAARLMLSESRAYKYQHVWVKTRKTAHLRSSYGPLAEHELILMFNFGLVTCSTYNPVRSEAETLRGSRSATESHGKHYSAHGNMPAWADDGTRHPTTVLYYPSPKRTKESHPSQKPVSLLQYLILTYSNYNDVVADPFMGSGSAGVAAISLKRRFCGCDVNQHWVEHAGKAIAQEAMVEPLFSEKVDAS
ncbi:MAG: site-specific DNA-methyltransferase [Deinococcota bacterium]